MRYFYTRRNIIIALVLSLVIILVFVVLSYHLARQAMTQSRAEYNTLASLRRLENLMDDMQDIETSQRGYLITGNRSFLVPYISATERLQADTGDVAELIRIFPQRADTLRRLLHFVHVKIAEAAINVDLHDRGMRDSAQARVKLGYGKVAMDSIRRILSNIEDRDREDLQHYNNQRKAAARSSAIFIVLLVSSLLIGLLILFWKIFRDLELKKKHEETIVHLAGLTEKTSDAIISTDLEGHILSWNTGAEKMFGYSKEEALGRFSGAVTRSGRTMEDVVRETENLQGRDHATVEMLSYTRDGKPLDCLASITPLRDDDNRITGYVAILRDITAMKRNEQLLEKFNEELNVEVKRKTDEIKEKEERYRRIVETSHEGIWMLDVLGKTTFTNNRITQILGYAPEELAGRTLADLVDPAQRAVLQDIFQEDNGRVTREHEILFRTKEGRPLWTLVSVTTIFRNGEPDGMLAMILDIDERKKALDEIRRSNESFELISKTTNDAVWEWNLESDQLWANETNQRLYGLTKNDPVPREKVWAAHIHPDDRDRIIETQRRTLNSDENVFISEYRFNTADKGYRDIYDRCYIVRDKNGKPVRMTGSMMDITERKTVQQALQKSEEENRFAFEYSPIVVWEEDFSDIKNYLDRLPEKDRRDLQSYFAREPRELEKIAGMIRVTRINQKTLDFYQAQTKEEVFSKFPGTFDEESLRVFQEEIITLYSGQPVFSSEVPVSMPDGSRRQLLISVSVPPMYQSSFSKVFFSFIDITDRKRAEEQIVREKELSDTVINSLPGIFYMFDVNRRFLRWNKNFEIVSGYSAAELTTVPAEMFFAPEDRERARATVEKIFRTGSAETEALFLTRSGKKIPFFFTGRALNYDNLQCMMGTGIDISEQHEVQQELRRNEEKYRTLVEQAIDAIALYDKDGKILDVNTGSINLLGYSKHELMKMKLSDILTNEEIRFSPVRYDVLQTGESTVKQRRMRRKDGTIVETEVRSQQLPDGRFLSVIRDLSERIKAQQAIEEEKKLSDKLIDSLPGVFYWYDEHGKFLRWNRHFETVTGYTSAEIAEMHPVDFFEGDDKSYIVQRIGKVFDEGTSDAEADFTAKDGTKTPYYFKAVRLDYNNKPCLLGTGIDISDRKKAEKELEASNEMLRQLTEHLQNIREEERSHIAREIHDELGQQLTVLKMDISWLNKKVDAGDEKVKQRLAELMSMIDTTVRSVRKISSELRPSILDDLGLGPAIDWQGQEFEKRSGIRVETEIDMGDRRLPDNIAITLFRIFQESLTNVARHAQATRVEAKLYVDGTDVHLSISDNGVGFRVKDIENKKTLGILGMKERASIIGGDYRIESKPKEGTIVSVRIPLKENEQ